MMLMNIKTKGKIKNADAVILQLERAGFVVGPKNSNAKEAASAGYNAIIGRRNSPLIFKY
jgi:hypothetical protein